MNPIRRVVTEEPNLYLSFDDGPCPMMTPQVLDLLHRYKAKATFFIIGNKAIKHKELVIRTLKAGHSIGNHSMDHNYRNFFKQKEHLIEWIKSSHQLLRDQFSVEPVGFRSPAGIVTPPLKAAMAELNIPWIHWSCRYYDTSIPLALMAKFKRFTPGDIILLHDVQRNIYRKGFLHQLEQILRRQRDKGFDFKALKKENFDHG